MPWQWLHDNFDSVLQRLPGFAQPVTFLYRMDSATASGATSSRQFLTPKSRELGMGELELARSLEHIGPVASRRRLRTRLTSGLHSVVRAVAGGPAQSSPVRPLGVNTVNAGAPGSRVRKAES